MEIQYRDFIVEITRDYNYNPDSTDNNRGYLMRYIDPTEDRSILLNRISIIICDGIEEISSAIIYQGGSVSSIHENSFIIKDDNIFICCGPDIYSLSVPHLTLNWKSQVDTATCFAIYEYEDDFIVHGELEISRITQDGIIKWTFGASDIFVSITGEKEFEIVDGKIILMDYSDKKYILAGNGKLIS